MRKPSLNYLFINVLKLSIESLATDVALTLSLSLICIMKQRLILPLFRELFFKRFTVSLR